MQKVFILVVVLLSFIFVLWSQKSDGLNIWAKEFSNDITVGLDSSGYDYVSSTEISSLSLRGSMLVNVKYFFDTKSEEYVFKSKKINSKVVCKMMYKEDHIKGTR